jgi:hypothetical protein
MNADDRNHVMQIVIQLCPKILVCGWWSLEEDVAWYAIWRDRHRNGIVDEYIVRATGLKPVETETANPERPKPRDMLSSLYTKASSSPWKPNKRYVRSFRRLSISF